MLIVQSKSTENVCRKYHYWTRKPSCTVDIFLKLADWDTEMLFLYAQMFVQMNFVSDSLHLTTDDFGSLSNETNKPLTLTNELLKCTSSKFNPTLRDFVIGCSLHVYDWLCNNISFDGNCITKQKGLSNDKNFENIT